MKQIYTFHKTVRGHLHIMNEIPCEDASTSFASENGKYGIAVVADGHGSKVCFRSEYGAKIAVDTALGCLKQFAETTLISEEVENRFYEDMFSNRRYRQMTLKHLTDTLIANWHDGIMVHYENHPPSAEEMGESAEEYQNGKDIAHMYGTTVIAALQLPKCLVLLQQGDGRCEVFFDDGSIEQPIPWDSRCEGTATTSLCDEDVTDSFRSCVIDLSERPVAACFLGCDGIEDAYRDTYEDLGGSHGSMGGVHAFYKDLSCQLVLEGREKFAGYLETMLPEFSANGKFSRSGSGDDVSVAGIVDIEKIGRHIGAFQSDVERYALEEELFWKEDALRGKTRKHGILEKRMKEAQKALEDEEAEQQAWEIKLQQVKDRRKMLQGELEKEEKELEEYCQEAQSVTKCFEYQKEEMINDAQGKRKVYKFLASQIKNFVDDISIGYSQRENVCGKLYTKLAECDDQIQKIDKIQQERVKKIQELKDNLFAAQKAFNEYDAKYRKIDSERKCIVDRITALLDKNNIGFINLKVVL